MIILFSEFYFNKIWPVFGALRFSQLSLFGGFTAVKSLGDILGDKIIRPHFLFELLIGQTMYISMQKKYTYINTNVYRLIA